MIRRLITVGVIILLFVCVNVSGGFEKETKDASTFVFDGNILYVGGSGPNNYTRIQDAIDNASDGDTVFVYDDSSPYEEQVTIDKSINLIGENKLTTVIDGVGAEKIVGFNCEYGLLKNFTFTNGEIGVYQDGTLNVIDNCIFDSCMLYCGDHGIIYDCDIFNCDIGIYFEDYAELSEVWFSNINNCTIGIEIFSYGVQIYNSNFYGNDNAIINHIIECYITDCNFTSNINGIVTDGKSYTYIKRCNFTNNQGSSITCGKMFNYIEVLRSSFINNNIGITISTPSYGYLFANNNFINNGNHFYIDKSSILKIMYHKYNSNFFEEWAGATGYYHIYGFFNWDFNPAQEPYDI